MNTSKARHLETWEGEGGATLTSPIVSSASMTGTASQIEWAKRVKRQVNAEFDRVTA